MPEVPAPFRVSELIRFVRHRIWRCGKDAKSTIRTGMCGEHKFSEISVNALDVDQSIQSKWLQILLPLGTE